MSRGDKLGEGTFGIVYSTASEETGEQRALKRLLAEDKTSFISAVRELDILNKLRGHPYIVQLTAVIFGESDVASCFSPLQGHDRANQRDDAIHFEFEFAKSDLHNYIYAEQPDYALIKQYMVDILLGMEYMHGHGILHRDLKPSNILLFDNDVAKICDMGLSKPYTYQGIQTPGASTSWYRSPDMALGYPHYDYKTDVWSIGCIFYEMIAKRPFIRRVSDNDDAIVSAILGALPAPLPLRKFRELIRSNKWRTVRLSAIHDPKIRTSFIQKFRLTKRGTESFQKDAGSLELFSDLLSKLLAFDWDERITVSEALNHPFFDDSTAKIQNARNKYPPIIGGPSKLLVRRCKEREWMVQSATFMFNHKDQYTWYSHRILFQAMDLYDRYLTAMFEGTTIPPNAIESDYKGLLHNKFEAEIRFLTCVYLCIKYFSSIHIAIPFESIVSDEYKTPEAMAIAEQFEGGFIKGCLEFNIYRPTLYEAADYFRDNLDDIKVRGLFVLYSCNYSINGKSIRDVYSYFRNHLEKDNLEALLVEFNEPNRDLEPLPIDTSKTGPSLPPPPPRNRTVC